LQEHGDYVVDRYDQVILFAGRGPWNEQTLRKGTIETGQLIQALDKSRPWAQLSLVVGESLMPPSAYNTFLKQTMIRKSLGLSALAIVIQNSDISATIQRQFREAYQQAEIEYVFTTSITEGVDWLAQKGFELPANKLTAFCKRCSFI
jgi:hypothetical protein